jgi:predicted secreted hydrolase
MIIIQTSAIPATNINSLQTKFKEYSDNHLTIPSLQSSAFSGISLFNNFFSKKTQMIDPSDSQFRPENLSDSDDAYHSSNLSYATEWWYFDAILNEQYTFQFSIHIYKILNTGFASTQCNIYERGKTILSESSIHQLSSLQLSLDKPFISINDQIVMQTFSSQIDNSMTYQLSYSEGNYSFNLLFQETTKGWKGTTSAGDWAVVLPKAPVSGTINLQNNIIKVNGVGYHDHNWNVSISAGLNFGWLWGKTVLNKYTFTWASIYKTWYMQNPLLVINEDDNGYTNVPIENIDFSVTKIEFKNGMFLPYGFRLYAQTNEYTITLFIDIFDSDYVTVLGLINYWRYHIHARGTLKIDDHTHTIDDYNIAEFMRFRPY